MAAILVFVDFSDATITVMHIARQMAKAFDMKLILMHISTPDVEAEGSRLRKNISRHAVATELHHYRRELKLLATECNKLGVETSALLVPGRSVRGNPVPKMVSELKRVKPALIVMGTHQHGRLFEAMFGSPTSVVVHKAVCPIVLVPSKNRSMKWPPKS